MTTHEVFTKITSPEKWYAGYITAQAANQLIKRYKANTLSFERLTSLFNHFGYELTSSWDKSLIEKSIRKCEV